MNQSLRVGLLDSDSDVRFGRRMLIASDKSLEIVFESDGLEQDLELIQQSLIDLLVIDQRLAFGPGVDFYLRLRESMGPKGAPSAILTSSFSQPALTLAAVQAGFSQISNLEDGAASFLKLFSLDISRANTIGLESLAELVRSTEASKQSDLEFTLSVSALPEKYQSNIRRLSSIWNKLDPQKLAGFDMSSLEPLAERLPVKTVADAVIRLYRTGFLDAK